FKLWNDALRQRFPQFHPPLVKGINLPDRALRENTVLVQGDEAAQHLRRELIRKDGVRRPVALEDAGRQEPVSRAFAFYLLGSFSKRQGFCLRENIGDQYVVV